MLCRSSPFLVRRLVVPVAALSTALLPLIAATPAKASPAAPWPFGLIATPTPAGTPRSYFNLTIRPGQSVTEHAIIVNQGHRTERLRVLVSKGVTAANSGSAYETKAGPCAGTRCWISGLPSVVTLPAGYRRFLAFQISVPRRTARGQYLVGITATPALPPPAVRVARRDHSSTKAIIIDQVTVGVAITVGRLSALPGELRLGRVRAGRIGSTPRLYLPVRNTGLRFERATGHFTCHSGRWQRTYPVIMETVLPGERAVLPVNAPGLTAGSFSCTAKLAAGRRTFASPAGTVRLLSATRAKVYHPADGVYVTLPSRALPFWVIAGYAIGALILVVIAVLLIRTRKRPTPF
jgi:hypothetical protein